MSSALLEAIVAAPHDDGPRLVYADWLLERGDLRGELLIAQCALAACEAEGDRTSERYRGAWIQDHVLTRDHAVRITESYGLDPLLQVVFERGLPIHALVDFERDPVEPIPRYPFERLSLEMNRPLLLGELRRILARPLPASLQHIQFGKAFVSVDIDVALARDALARTDAPDEARVWPEDSDLPIPPFDETVRRYAGPMPLHVPLPPSVRDIVITAAGFGPIPPERWREVRETEAEAIAIFGDSDDEACAAIDALPFERLRDFSLVASPSYGAAVAKAFAGAVWGASRLQGIDCAFPMDDAVARALERSPLRLLRAVGGGARDALANILVRHPLHTLELAELRSSDAVALLAVDAPPTLSNLTLDWFTFEDHDVEALAASDRLAGIIDLQLHECTLSRAAKEHLLAAENLARIPSIRIDADTRREP